MHRSILLALALFSAPLAAREWHVATHGDDASGDGSAARPLRTLRHVLAPANAGLADGDSVIVHAGTYAECDVRLRKRLTVIAAQGEHVHIQCDPGVADSVVMQIDPSASGSRVADLELSGSQYYGVKLETDWYRGEGAAGRGASQVTLERLRIHDTGRDGIKITPKCDHVTIRDSEIWNTGALDPPGTPLERRNAEGIDNVGGAFMHMVGNFIHDTATTGLYFKGGAADALVEGNRIERAGMAGILVGFDTSEEFFDLETNPGYLESMRAIVRNNLVRDSGYAGIGLYAASDALIANNTLIGNARLGHAAIYFGIPLQDWDPKAKRPPSFNPRILNNLVVQDQGACVMIRHSTELGGLSALAGKPGMDFNAFASKDGACRFIDMRPGGPWFGGEGFSAWQERESSDAHSLSGAFVLDADACPPAGSALIDAGTPLAEVTQDRRGRARTGKPDIGACEATARAP